MKISRMSCPLVFHTVVSLQQAVCNRAWLVVVMEPIVLWKTIRRLGSASAADVEPPASDTPTAQEG